MAFEATKREWGELYAFFRLLADGYVYAGTPEVKKNEAQRLPEIGRASCRERV